MADQPSTDSAGIPFRLTIDGATAEYAVAAVSRIPQLAIAAVRAALMRAERQDASAHAGLDVFALTIAANRSVSSWLADRCGLPEAPSLDSASRWHSTEPRSLCGAC